jgi:hypothetical protein
MFLQENERQRFMPKKQQVTAKLQLVKGMTSDDDKIHISKLRSC